MLWWGTLGLLCLLYNLEASVSIRWPAGTYGIPKPKSRCPRADGFQWKTGWRFQDTDDTYSNNAKSAGFHLDGEVDKKKVNRSFCIKTDTTNVYEKNRSTWPSGQYCIYRKGAKCPTGLAQGFVYWDDDYFNNLNDKGGILPSGGYDKNTRIEFCCRTDGNKNEPILLPTKTPFFLLAYGSAKCQMVKWAKASPEWIYYDTESYSNDDDRGGAYPHDAGKEHPTIYYCYYRGCNETLSKDRGTFHSPNNPQKYPDGQFCSWRITVSPGQQIHLTFTSFNLQNENNTDGLYVYDGENDIGEELGVFYGGHPPPKYGINSSSNHMLVIFKSDKSVSDTGFTASYTAVNYSGPSVAPTKISSQKVTSPATIISKPLYTSEKTTTSYRRKPTATTNGPSNGRNGSGENKQRQKSEEKGLNIVAVVAPVVALVLLVSLLVAGFFLCKRKRTTKQNRGTPNEVVYLRSNDETPMSLENPYYDRDLTVGNTACSPVENELYTDVKEEHKNEEEACILQENENPLYEAAGGTTRC